MVVFIGQVRQRLRRARGVPGDRLPAHVRADDQVGGADRSRRAHSGVREPRLPHRDGGPARARWCWRCPRTCCSPRPPWRTCRKAHRVRPAPDASDVEELRSCSWRRRRAHSSSSAAAAGIGESTRRLQKWVEKAGLPAGTSFRCQDLFDNRSPSYAGDVGIGINPKLAQRVREADVLLVIGARLGEMTTSAYTLVEAPLPKQTLVHVHAGAEELGRVYRAGARDQLRLSAVRRCAREVVAQECRVGERHPLPARKLP